jgi:sulfatase modifying factor 1
LSDAIALLHTGIAAAVRTTFAVCAVLACLSPLVPMQADAQPSVPEPEMVMIPAGRFIMGVPDAEEIRENTPTNLRHLGSPQHAVTIPQAFDLGKYLITRDEFAAFVNEAGYSIPQGCWTIVGGRTGVNSPNRDWRDPGFPQTGRHPVVCVNRADAEAYAAWLSKRTGERYRLPTEAEWEYAARAGTTTARYWADDRDGEQRNANVADLSLMRELTAKPEDQDPLGYVPWDDGFPFTSPVGSFVPNQFGLYDMLGNVWEWTADCWHQNYKGAPVDGSAWTTGDCRTRVLRGASWGNYPGAVRSGLRSGNYANVRSSYYGFRLARPPAAPIVLNYNRIILAARIPARAN